MVQGMPPLQGQAGGPYHQQKYDSKPLLQADNGFLIDKDTKQGIPVLSCIDVTASMASSSVVPQNGVGDYPFAELRRCVLECSRSQGAIQTEQEASIRGLAWGLASYTGRPVRQAPAYDPEPQGSIERDSPFGSRNALCVRP